MTNNAEQVFMCYWFAYLQSLCAYLNLLFNLKKIGWFLLNVQEFCISIWDVCATNIFSSLWSIFSSLDLRSQGSFDQQTSLNLLKLNLLDLFWWVHVLSWKSISASRLWKYSAMFSLRNMDFGFIVRSMMDFGLIFEYGVRWDPHSFFPLYTSICCSNIIY